MPKVTILGTIGQPTVQMKYHGTMKERVPQKPLRELKVKTDTGLWSKYLGKMRAQSSSLIFKGMVLAQVPHPNVKSDTRPWPSMFFLSLSCNFILWANLVVHLCNTREASQILQCLLQMKGPGYVPSIVILIELNQHLLQSPGKPTRLTLSNTNHMPFLQGLSK